MIVLILAKLLVEAVVCLGLLLGFLYYYASRENEKSTQSIADLDVFKMICHRWPHEWFGYWL